MALSEATNKLIRQMIEIFSSSYALVQVCFSYGLFCSLFSYTFEYLLIIADGIFVCVGRSQKKKMRW